MVKLAIVSNSNVHNRESKEVLEHNFINSPEVNRCFISFQQIPSELVYTKHSIQTTTTTNRIIHGNCPGKSCDSTYRNQ